MAKPNYTTSYRIANQWMADKLDRNLQRVVNKLDEYDRGTVRDRIADAIVHGMNDSVLCQVRFSSEVGGKIEQHRFVREPQIGDFIKVGDQGWCVLERLIDGSSIALLVENINDQMARNQKIIDGHQKGKQ